MIYFLDNSLQLQKIVTSKNIISAIHEHELNGLIRGDIELDLSYANKFLILGIDHVGYYYKDEFYLHKIQRVEYDHVNETAKVVLRHIFFEDMIFGKLIQDVRPQNQDALTVSRQTIDANTRWQTIMTDVTGRLSTNFYWQVPYEVIEFMTENYRIEYLPKILFDGQNINGFQLHLANKIGVDKNIRIPYGSRVLDLKYEEDYSEIITKLVVHGKGEEVGDGYGRRINISDVNFSRNGVKSPVGSLYLEDESITNTYGNDGQTPREGREVFEDIEDANELAEAGFQHYLQVSRPQMLFTADVADIGDVGIGDSVMIIRREYDVYFNARIHKLSVDLLYPEDAQVELGDYEHFKESKIARKTREKNNRVQGQLSDRITRLKLESNERFDNEVTQWKSEYEQALIDVHAEIEADRENMTNLIEGTRTEFTDNLTAEITQTKEYAEQQAQAQAGAVRTELETVTSGHQALIDSLKDNVLDIDTFLGDKSKTLAKQFTEMESGLNQSITAESGRIDAIVTNFGDSGKSLSQFVLDVGGIEQTVAANDEWLGTHGSNVLQTVEGFNQKVWQSDIQNPNILPYSNMSESSNHAKWLTRPASASTGTFLDYMIVRDFNAGSYLSVLSPLIYDYVVEGESYTVSWEASFSTPSNPIDRGFKYFYILRPTEGNFSLSSPKVTDLGGQVYRYELTFVMPKLDPFMRIIFGTHTAENQDNFFRIRKAKLEKSSFATPYDSAFSMLEQRADEISLKVQDLASIDGEDLLTQSDISVSGGRITIGSQVIGSDDLASIISVSPTAIDMITDKLNLTGNLNVRGQITTLAVDAIEGNFARLFANQLTADVITTEHIAASTSLINKLFASSARIDQLITKSHFVNEMHALTLNVVDLNASQIRTRLLTANTIEADWIKSGTALLDRVFSSTAMFEHMMAKSAFVTTLSTVTLDLYELTIWRPDGVAFVQNGVPRFGTPVFFKPWMSAEGTVTFDGSNYNTTMAGAQRFEIAYTEHAGRFLSIGFSANLRYSSSSTSTYMGVVVRVANQPSSTNIQTVIKDDILVFRDNPANEFQIDVPLGRPTYGALTFQLEFYRIGGTSANTVQIRSGRAWING